MDYCQCEYLTRLANSINLFLSNFISSGNYQTSSLSDSGTLLNQPHQSENTNNSSSSLFFILLIVLLMFLRVMQRNNQQNNRHQNNESNQLTSKNM
jgi:hypothetical protein